MNKTDEFIADAFLRDKLVRIRKASGRTQKQLAEESGLSVGTISSIESNRGAYTSSSLIRYCDALGYEVTIHRKGQSIKSGLEE